MKKIFLAVAAAFLALGFAAWGGLWRPESVYYWREAAQSLFLATARQLPIRKETSKLIEALTKSALSVHLDGVTPIELSQAAYLLEQVDQPKDSSQLWLGLTRSFSANGDFDKARSAAKNSVRLAVSSQGLSSLILLYQNEDEQNLWIQQLGLYYPQHELSIAFACLAATRNLYQDPSSACDGVDWVRDKAWHVRNEEKRLIHEIIDLPRKAADEISKSEDRIKEAANSLPEINRKLEIIAHEQKNLGWAAVGEVILERLPLPKAGDTLEQFVVRETGCAFRWMNPFCIGASILKALDSKRVKEDFLNQESQRLKRFYTACSNLIVSERLSIEDWKSDYPHQRLINERGCLLKISIKVFVQMPIPELVMSG